MLWHLTANVAAETAADTAAEKLLAGLKTELDAAIAAQPETVDTTQLQALSDAIGTNSTALAAAVVANTPAAVA